VSFDRKLMQKTNTVIPSDVQSLVCRPYKASLQTPVDKILSTGTQVTEAVNF
jgi:hypothetical protein